MFIGGPIFGGFFGSSLPAAGSVFEYTSPAALYEYTAPANSKPEFTSPVALYEYTAPLLPDQVDDRAG